MTYIVLVDSVGSKICQGAHHGERANLNGGLG